MKRFLLTLLKLAVSVGLLAYLIIQIQHSDPETFTRLRHTAPRWPFLILGWGCLVGSLSAGALRWYAVLRALGVPIRFDQLFRYATFSFALHFAALGTAGGDLVKALLLSRDQPGSGPVILTSVVIDRVIGLYGLLTIAAIILLTVDPLHADLYVLRVGLIGAALGMNVFLASLWFAPGLGNLIERQSAKFGRLGKAVAEVVPALRAVRDRPLSLLPIALANLVALNFLVSGCYFVAASLPGEVPTFAEQWQIMPIAMLSDLLPLPGGTLGALDFAMSFLYRHVTAGRVPLGQGLLVAMLSRVVNVLVCTVAAVLYVRWEPRRRRSPPLKKGG